MTDSLERAGWCWFRLYDERVRFRQRLALLERGRSVGEHAEYLTEVVALLDAYLADLSRVLEHETRDHPCRPLLRSVLPAPVADAFCAVIGDLTRFATARHLVAYLGLAPHRVRRTTLNRVYFLHAGCLVRRAPDTRWAQAYHRARARGLPYKPAIRCAWRALLIEAWKKNRPQTSTPRATEHSNTRRRHLSPRASAAHDRARRDCASPSGTDGDGTCHHHAYDTRTTDCPARNPR